MGEIELPYSIIWLKTYCRINWQIAIYTVEEFSVSIISTVVAIECFPQQFVSVMSRMVYLSLQIGLMMRKHNVYILRYNAFILGNIIVYIAKSFSSDNQILYCGVSTVEITTT